MRFVDTDVLPYAVSRDPAEQDKAKTANDILAERDLALSEQVLQGTPRSSRPPARGCTHVLSEDLSDGQDYGGVRIANPFR